MEGGEDDIEKEREVLLLFTCDNEKNEKDNDDVIKLHSMNEKRENQDIVAAIFVYVEREDFFLG